MDNNGVDHRQPAKLEVVGACPACGSPIYGKQIILAGDPLNIIYSCTCQQRKSIQDTMRTT